VGVHYHALLGRVAVALFVHLIENRVDFGVISCTWVLILFILFFVLVDDVTYSLDFDVVLLRFRVDCD
jgi:hypothetical protein